MKKLYSILKMVLWCFVGVFVGSSIYQYCDYKAHSGLYEMQSAPWYLSVLFRGVFTAIIVAVIFIAMRIIKKKTFH